MSLSVILLRADYEDQTETPYYNFCVFAGFFIQVSAWMVLNAVTSIMFYLVISIFSTKNPEKFELFFLLYTFIFPLTFNWIPFINLTYGKAGAWCWIRSLDEHCDKYEFGRILQLALLYVPLYIIIFLLIVIYLIVLIKLHLAKKQWTGKFDLQTERVRQQVVQEILPLMAYPVIFFVFNIPPFISRIYNQVAPRPVFWFLAAIIYPLQSGVIAIVFSLDPETRRRLTLANFRAAFSELCTKYNIVEYPIQNISNDESLKEGLLE